MSAGGRAADATLTAPDALLARILDALPDATVVTSADGVVVAANAVAERLFGRPAGGLTGAALPAPLDAAALEAHARPLRLGGEDLVCTVLRDVSPQRRVEEQLRDSLEELERSAVGRRKLLAAIVHAQEEERARIAADMHDDTIQAITGVHIRLQMEAARTVDPAQRDALDTLQEQVGEALARLRRLAFELRPPALDRHGLAAAVEEQLERLRSETGLVCRFADDLPAPPPDDVAAVLFRVAKEALVNVVKHASATEVGVALRAAGTGFELTVADDGVGSGDVALRPRAGHLGLATMRERVEAAGGNLTVGPGPGAGTLVRVWVPGERRRRPRPESEVVA